MIGSSENPLREITKNHKVNKILIETQEDFRQTRKTSNKIIVVTRHLYIYVPLNLGI